jgi:hypothetical protein
MGGASGKGRGGVGSTGAPAGVSLGATRGDGIAIGGSTVRPPGGRVGVDSAASPGTTVLPVGGNDGGGALEGGGPLSAGGKFAPGGAMVGMDGRSGIFFACVYGFINYTCECWSENGTWAM